MSGNNSQSHKSDFGTPKPSIQYKTPAKILGFRAKANVSPETRNEHTAKFQTAPSPGSPNKDSHAGKDYKGINTMKSSLNAGIDNQSKKLAPSQSHESNANLKQDMEIVNDFCQEV